MGASQYDEAIVWLELPTLRFTMGSDRNLGQPGDDEGPTRDVTVGSIAVSASPISVGHFGAFVTATGFVTVAEREGTGFIAERSLAGQNAERVLIEGATWRDPRADGLSLDQASPVRQVAWSDAIEFCRWANTHLLTEAEWERCARNGVHTMATQPELEWVADYYDAAFFRDEQRVNPTGPIGGTHRVARGGGHVSRRSPFLPDMSADDLTFRVRRSTQDQRRNL